MLPWQLEGETAPRYDFLEIKLIRQRIAAAKNDRRFTDVNADIKKQRASLCSLLGKPPYLDGPNFPEAENKLRVLQFTAQTHAGLFHAITTTTSEKVTGKLNLGTFLQTCNKIKELCTGFNQCVVTDVRQRIIPSLDCNVFRNLYLNHTFSITVGSDFCDRPSPVFDLHIFNQRA
jgi:hypothetical protein